jgi:hypothetical protein
VVDCGSTLSVVERGSNRRVSKNHIGDTSYAFFDTLLFDPRSTTLKAILLTFTPAMRFFDTLLFDPRSTTLKDRIAGVKVSRIALSVVDRGSNRRVSKNA